MIKTLSSIENQESEFLHFPFRAIEVREGDAMKASITIGGKTHSVKIWRYSPFGLEFISEGWNISIGEKCDLNMDIAGEKLSYVGLSVSQIKEERSYNIVGLRIFRPKRMQQSEFDEKRTAVRWNCPREYLPTGSAPNPLKFNDFILFRIDNISAGGIKIVTSMRNKMLAIGQTLESSISLPYIGNLTASIQIKYIDTEIIDNKEYLTLGAKLINPDEILLQSISEYLLNFGEGISISSLKKDGFHLGAASKWLDFGYVQTEEEYRKVLELRYKVYKLAGKVDSDTKIEHFADQFDARSRILCVKFKEQIVGSVRVMFHQKMEETHIEADGCSIPPNLPPAQESVEASRLCVDPDMRGSDIARQLQAHMVLLTIKAGRRYMFGAATDALVGFWEKAGWQKSGVRYKNKGLKGIEHELITIDTHKAACGKGISAKAWVEIYSTLFDYMLETDLIAPTAMDTMRIQYYKTFGKFF